jgi:hypothetical protein
MRIVFGSVVAAVAVFLTGGVANAQTGTGTLGVNATVQGSISLTFLTNVSGLAVTGTGTSVASLPFGNVTMYGSSVPANVTKALNGVTSFDLSTPFDLRVDLANSASTTFTLSAILAAPDSINVWTLAGAVGPTDISDGASHTTSSTGAYAAAFPHTLKLTVPASSAAGLITNSIGFTVVGH